MERMNLKRPLRTLTQPRILERGNDDDKLLEYEPLEFPLKGQVWYVVTNLNQVDLSYVMISSPTTTWEDWPD